MSTTSTVKEQGKNVSKIVNSAVLARKNVQMIFLQQAITLSAFRYFSGHQDAARAHANKWEGVWKAILFTTTEIIDFAETFSNSYQQIRALAQILRTGTAEEKARAKTNVLTVMNQLILGTLKDKRIIAAQIVTNAEIYYKSFLPNYNSFLYDSNIAYKIMRINDIDDKLNNLSADLAEAKAKALKLEIAIMAEAGITPYTIAGTYAAGPVGVIVGGIMYPIDIRGLAGMFIEYADAIKEINSIQYQITEMKAEMTHLHEVESQITGLHNASLYIVEGAKSVENGWLALYSEMQTLIKRAEGISPEELVVMIGSELAIMNKDWQDVIEPTRKLQPIGGAIGHITYKTVDDMLLAITPRSRHRE